MSHVSPLIADPVGAGPSLVALHASGMSSRQFARLARDASSHYRVYAVDLLGVGRTPLPESPAYSLALEVDALLSLLESLDEPAYLFGHSYGGLVAMEAAMRAPSRVRAMALYEPVIVVLGHAHGSPETRAQIDAITPLMRSAEGGDYTRWIEGFIDWWNAPGFYRSLPAPTQAQYLATAHEAYRQASLVPTSTLTVEGLRALETPTLLITGESSPISARESAKIAAEALPNGELVRIDRAGHMGPLTHTAAVNAAALAFFAKR